ncbi:MAG: Lrp/AsnC family transcriptional regulator [Promethearchaeota archaeon]
MNNNQIKLDKIDLKLISVLQKDPSLTHYQIAEIINRSQPTVGTRVRKLKEKGILQFQAGINFKKIGIQLAIVNLNTKNPEEIVDMVNDCPFMLNAFRLSGTFNMSVLIANTNLRKLNNVVDQHFRNNSNVQKIVIEFITDTVKNFILPIDIDSELILPNLEDGCSSNCRYCEYNRIMRFKKS